MSDASDLIDALLEPFPGPVPAGIDPRLDESGQSLYRQLRDARTEARRIERAANTGPAAEGKPASPAEHWRTVRTLAPKLLKEQGKDMEAAAWLTEALVRHSGFAGLAAGASLIAGLADRFWDAGLHPLDAEDGVDALVKPVAALSGDSADGTVAQPLRMQVMFKAEELGDVSFWLYGLARETEALSPAEKKQRLSANVPAFPTLDRDAHAAGPAHFNTVRNELDAAAQAWSRMAAVLDDKAGRHAPSTRRVTELLAGFLATVEHYASARAAPSDDTVREEPAEVAPAEVASPGAAAPAATRETMLLRLGEIAAYFRRHEPQSPLSMTLEEAVRRARLNWRELLEEVVPSEDGRNAILLQLGIRPNP